MADANGSESVRPCHVKKKAKKRWKLTVDVPKFTQLRKRKRNHNIIVFDVAELYTHDTTVIQCIHPDALQRKFKNASAKKWLSYENNVYLGKRVNKDITHFWQKEDLLFEVHNTKLDIDLPGSVFQVPFGNRRNDFVLEEECVEYQIRLYLIHVVRDRFLISLLPYLVGKRLACWCVQIDEDDEKSWQPVTTNDTIKMKCSCECLLYLIEVLSLNDDNECRESFRFMTDHWKSPRSSENYYFQYDKKQQQFVDFLNFDIQDKYIDKYRLDFERPYKSYGFDRHTERKCLENESCCCWKCTREVFRHPEKYHLDPETSFYVDEGMRFPYEHKPMTKFLTYMKEKREKLPEDEWSKDEARKGQRPLHLHWNNF